jgi:hypothetical protein
MSLAILLFKVLAEMMEELDSPTNSLLFAITNDGSCSVFSTGPGLHGRFFRGSIGRLQIQYGFKVLKAVI